MNRRNITTTICSVVVASCTLIGLMNSFYNPNKSDTSSSTDFLSQNNYSSSISNVSNQNSNSVTTNIELLVTRETTGANVTKSYNITLGENEVIVGQSYSFRYKNIVQSGGGSAFIIKGLGKYSFTVTDGEWLKYNNVVDNDQAESLLNSEISYLENTLHYSANSIKISRINN
jgi:hypothetical protein